MLVSVIIPTLNEEDQIAELVRFLLLRSFPSLACEVIVVDGGSTDQTLREAIGAGASTARGHRGRASQMNQGASMSKGDVLFFLHADTRPPGSFLCDIAGAVEEGYPAGSYRLAFDYDHWFLRFNCWFTRFNFTPFRFGDQGLFMTRELFERLGGFDQNLFLIEDQEMIWRIKKIARLKIFDAAAVTSARKYLENGIFKLQLIFVLIYFLYRLGISQDKLAGLYQRLIIDKRIESCQDWNSCELAEPTIHVPDCKIDSRP